MVQSNATTTNDSFPLDFCNSFTSTILVLESLKMQPNVQLPTLEPLLVSLISKYGPLVCQTCLVSDSIPLLTNNSEIVICYVASNY